MATHVTVRNVITSMRLLSSVEWADFFESVSLVEEALREGTRVAEMDFATRDQYRRAVEELARGSRFSEVEVARRAARSAWKAAAGLPGGGFGGPQGPPPRSVAESRLEDPGYFLISEGRASFEKRAGLPRSRPALG